METIILVAVGVALAPVAAFLLVVAFGIACAAVAAVVGFVYLWFKGVFNICEKIGDAAGKLLSIGSKPKAP